MSTFKVRIGERKKKLLNRISHDDKAFEIANRDDQCDTQGQAERATKKGTRLIFL